MDHHAPVLLAEVIDALHINPAGTYVDGTFGRGGHSAHILERLGETGRLIGLDRDSTAIEFGRRKFEHDDRLLLVKSEFSQVAEVVEQHAAAGKADGILLDLGVSSPQLDNADRGFSFRADGPLDMRMDASSGRSAAEWIATAEEQDMRTVIKTLGEERFARRIAAAIVERRQQSAITTTKMLADLIVQAVPRTEKRIHPATRTFQAIRIHINDELGQLRKALSESLRCLKTGGRLAVISFHSLEDRIVKRFMRDNSRGDVMYSGMPNPPPEALPKLKLVGKQIRATSDETEVNRRARSAVMRVAEKLSTGAAQ